MEWLTANWFWVLIGILFVGMHLFGRGGMAEVIVNHAAMEEKKTTQRVALPLRVRAGISTEAARGRLGVSLHAASRLTIARNGPSTSPGARARCTRRSDRAPESL